MAGVDDMDKLDVNLKMRSEFEDKVLENAGNARTQLMLWMSGASEENPHAFQLQAADILINAGMALQSEWESRAAYKDYLAQKLNGEVPRLNDLIGIENQIKVLEAQMNTLHNQVFQP